MTPHPENKFSTQIESTSEQQLLIIKSPEIPILRFATVVGQFQSKSVQLRCNGNGILSMAFCSQRNNGACRIVLLISRLFDWWDFCNILQCDECTAFRIAKALRCKWCRKANVCRSNRVKSRFLWLIPFCKLQSYWNIVDTNDSQLRQDSSAEAEKCRYTNGDKYKVLTCRSV
jgi:hypothetical protein